jgi:hypothetical protein
MKDVIGYEGLYKVDQSGNVYLKRNGKKLSPSDNGIGYLVLSFTKEKKRKCVLVHRLVAEAFIPNPENKRTVNHKDGNKLNNHVSNLEWMTHGENIRHLRDVLGFDFHQMNKDKTGSLNWNSKKVNQYTLDGVFVSSYGSTTEAMRETGIDCSTIQKVCVGKRKSAGYYLWEYEN